MMLEPAMLAPVLSQPALPLKDPAGLEIAPEEIQAVRERLEREDLTVLGFPPFFAERVACPHSVVTVHLIDEARQPTIAARDEILSFFARRLARTSAKGERPGRSDALEG